MALHSVPKYDSEYKKAKTVSRLRPFVNRIRDNQEPNLQSPFFDNVYQHYDVADGFCAWDSTDYCGYSH